MRGEPSRLVKPSTHKVESYSIVPVDGNCGLVTCSVGTASALINGRCFLSLLNSFYAGSQISLESLCRDSVGPWTRSGGLAYWDVMSTVTDQLSQTAHQQIMHW